MQRLIFSTFALRKLFVPYLELGPHPPAQLQLDGNAAVSERVPTDEANYSPLHSLQSVHQDYSALLGCAFFPGPASQADVRKDAQSKTFGMSRKVQPQLKHSRPIVVGRNVVAITSGKVRGALLRPRTTSRQSWFHRAHPF